MQRVAFGFLFLLVLAAPVLCYLPGLHGGFLFDDVVNIRNNSALALTSLDPSQLWRAATSSSAGYFQRPLSMLSFGLNAYWSGLDPYAFKMVNLALHLVNGVLVYLLTLTLLRLYEGNRSAAADVRCTWISLGVAALWLLHPLNLTVVLYVVQRMTGMAALLTITGLLLYLHGRERLLLHRSGAWPCIFASIFLFTPLAAMSKESGLLLPALMYVAEITLIKWRGAKEDVRKLKYLFALLLMLPLVLAVAFLLFKPEIILGGYAVRNFNVIERLLSEGRALWFYLHMTFLPNLTAMGIYHDDFAVSRGLLDPWTTLPAVVGIVGLVTSAWLARKRHALVSFAILFFLIGHSMESTFIPLELMHEHRHYLPMFGILLPTVYYLLSPVPFASAMGLRRVGFGLMLILFAGLTGLRSAQWGTPFGMLQMEVQHHPSSVRAHGDLAFQYAYRSAANQIEAEENYRHAHQHYTEAAYLSDTDTIGFFGILGLNAERGITTDRSWTDELERRLNHQPSQPGSINSLVALEKCYVSGRCRVEAALMERLLRAALNNPTLGGSRRSAALFALSDFLYKSRNQQEEAMAAAYAASAADPRNVSQQLTLVSMLINMQEFDRAEAEIDRLKAGDSMETYKISLADLQLRLINAKALSR